MKVATVRYEAVFSARQTLPVMELNGRKLYWPVVSSPTQARQRSTKGSQASRLFTHCLHHAGETFCSENAQPARENCWHKRRPVYGIACVPHCFYNIHIITSLLHYSCNNECVFRTTHTLSENHIVSDCGLDNRAIEVRFPAEAKRYFL
jgi:hypothetical protein